MQNIIIAIRLDAITAAMIPVINNTCSYICCVTQVQLQIHIRRTYLTMRVDQ